MHNMCLVRPALLYLNVLVLKVFYEQINYYYYYTTCKSGSNSGVLVIVAVTEMRDHRSRRQQQAKRSQQVRITVDDYQLGDQFSRSCVTDDQPHVTRSKRNSISGDPRGHRPLTSSSDEDDVIKQSRRYSLVPMYKSFI